MTHEDSKQTRDTAFLSGMDALLPQSWLPAGLGGLPRNWSWAERSDRIEDRTFRCMEDVRRRMVTNAEKAMTSHMDFVTHRLNADLDYVRSLTACRLPDEAMRTMQSFLRTLWQDYESQAQRSLELWKDSVSEGAACAEALTETAVEAVVEIEHAAEEEVALAAPSAPAETAAHRTTDVEGNAPLRTEAVTPADALAPAMAATPARKAPVRKGSGPAAPRKAPAKPAGAA
ncbi:phasin family protein [Pannonibacter tanglangensis]|uniref:Phasin domain-containing protein n=1 Tax=Pannonibacter tanglangensis TaxID=2750084 RepID=A0ABW9ZNY5_9HYPH|nr:phasin family protein [Pannonibacter sp. XCT-34]NBN66031.1 hypothetical protein [Pannonibacter sp. XCT-34]